MHVVRDGAQVVEELAEQVPAAVLTHHPSAQEPVARRLNGFFQQNTLAAMVNVAQPLIRRREWTVVGLGGG